MSRRPIRAVLPFEAKHLAMLTLQRHQLGEAERFGQSTAALADLGPAFTAAELDEAGDVAKVLCCAGLAEQLPLAHPSGGYASAWGSFAAELGAADMRFVTGAIRGVIDGCGYARLDMIVSAGFDRAERFAEALGFSLDSKIYARGAVAVQGRN